VASAHLTEGGQALIRIEDGGVGFQPGHLEAVNAMLAADEPPAVSGVDAGRLGLTVVRLLIGPHRIRVQLTARQPGGVIATVLIPVELLCEIPLPALDPPRAEYGARSGTALPGPSAAVHDLQARRRPQPVPRASAAATLLPMRLAGSLRAAADSTPVTPPSQRAPLSAQAWSDEIGAFDDGANYTSSEELHP
jgi:hypothetical protein